MHITKPYENRVHLYQRGNGKVHTFKNITEAARSLGWIQSMGSIGEQFEGFRFDYCMQRQIPLRYEFVLRDDDSEVVTEGELYHEYRMWKRSKRKRTPSWGYRQAGSKRTNGSMYRRIHTFQESKWADAWDRHNEEVSIKTRARRNRSNLPNTWDDYIRRDVEIKNWKRYRKTQWKGK